MYKSLNDCVIDLEKNGHLVRIKEEIDPNLEMAAVHLRIHEKHGPALLFEKVKGTSFPAVSNLFGTVERSKFIFRDTWEKVRQLIDIRNNPSKALKKPFAHIGSAWDAFSAIPLKVSKGPALDFQTSLQSLPQIKSWPNDGGPFITLPQVYSEDMEFPGPMNANLGMYRIQMAGNNYTPGKEMGLHYQIHRGIGVHQAKATELGKPLKVSIFVGGHPAHTVAAVMPLPEGVSELTFAGILSGRRFRYAVKDGYVISTDADFVITGDLFPGETKPEGPFGDHLGYYSLTHDFPFLHVKNIYHRKNAIWPFTVVGRPPQEDSAFGELIHELSGTALQKEIPGLKEVYAVDEAGVHPLLFATGSERYTPYLATSRPGELLTISNHILGTGQLSLAKYLFIANAADNPPPVRECDKFLMHMLERIDLKRDLHFQTETTIDTLDYSGPGLNTGSKLVLAAAGKPLRVLKTTLPPLELPVGYTEPRVSIPGILVIRGPVYGENTKNLGLLTVALELQKDILEGLPLIVVCDDSDFTCASVKNFLWTTFTKSNPATDVHGLFALTMHKHWQCSTSMIIDARWKPHHAPSLEKDAETEERIKRFFAPGASLHRFS